MSLMRTALRIGAVQALLADPVIMKFCGGNVYDSRINAVSDSELAPMILIYTEDEIGDAFSPQNGGPPFDSRCDLVIETSVKSIANDDTNKEVRILTAVTDAELEATLDLLEQQSIVALTSSANPFSAVLNTKIVRRWPQKRTSRFDDNKTGHKMAVRVMCLVAQLETSEEEPLAPLLALLDILDTTTESYALLQSMVSQLAPSGAVPAPFSGVDLTVAPLAVLDPALAPDRVALTSAAAVQDFTLDPPQT